MATPPGQLDDFLDRWERAGLIDADLGRRIRHFEADATSASAAGNGRRMRDHVAPPSGTELLAYLGVLVALAGVLTLVYATGANLTLTGALTLGIGVIALAATREFSRRGGAPAARAAGACAALGAAAIGTAAGELAAAAALFTKTVVNSSTCGAVTVCPSFTSTDQSGNVLLGACIVLVTALILLRLLPARTAALVAIAAAYVAAAATINVAGLDADRDAPAIALVVLVASAVLAGYAETLPHRDGDVAGLLGFAAVIGATIPLYLLGGRSGVHLDVVAGVIAVVALTGGVVLRRPGVAYGAVVGLAGLVIDVGARNFSTPTSLGVFFSVSGMLAVAALVAATRLLRSRGGARAGHLTD